MKLSICCFITACSSAVEAVFSNAFSSVANGCSASGAAGAAEGSGVGSVLGGAGADTGLLTPVTPGSWLAVKSRSGSTAGEAG